MLNIARAGRTVSHSSSNSYVMVTEAFFLIWSIILSPTFLSLTWKNDQRRVREDKKVVLSRRFISEDWNHWKRKVRPSGPLGYCRQPEKGPLKTAPSKSRRLPRSCAQMEVWAFWMHRCTLGEVFWWRWNVAHFSSKMKCFQNILPHLHAHKHFSSVKQSSHVWVYLMIVTPEEAPSRKWEGAISSLPNKRGKDEAS